MLLKRAAQLAYTRYVDDRRMLRSHSTAMIPAALRALADVPAEDVLLVCPGIVYRRGAIDRLHTGTPHQLDLWRVTRCAPRMAEAAVDAGDLAEDLGDRVRDVLDEDAACVESVKILQETSCAVLPAQALARLGARPNQKNPLVKVVLRDLERTLTDRDANILRD